MLDRIKGAVSGWMAEQQAQGQTKKNLKGYGESLGLMLSDMHLSPPEIAALESRRKSLGLPSEDVRQIHIDVFTHMSKAILDDGVVTSQELQALSQVGTVLGIGWNDLPTAHLQTYQIAHACIGIQQGKLPQVPSGSTMIRSEPGEIVHAEIRAKVLDERVVARQYTGASSGVSVRICKGVTYRTGSTRGRSVPVTAVVPVDQGVLALTDRRMAFMGQNKSFSVVWPKVLSADPMADGVHLTFTSRTKSVTLQYEDPTYAEILAALLSHYMS